MQFFSNQKINILGFLLWSVSLIGCGNSGKIEPTNNPLSKQVSTVSPTVTPTVLKTPNANDNMSDKEFHENWYKKHLKVIAVFNDLTKMDSIYLGKSISDKDKEVRKNKAHKLVDSLSDDADSLIILAKMCRIFPTGGHQEMFAAAIYDITFLYSVKVVATKFKDDSDVMRKLKELEKFIVDGPLYGDFRLALDGKEPMFLYGKTPDALP
jgi:hypothetical protein